MLSVLRTDFLDSLSSRCNELEQYILKLNGKNRDCEEFEEVYRIVHSIKGAGGTHGLPLVTSICHYFEDLLTSPRITLFTEDFADQALQLVDLLQELSISSDDSGKVHEIEAKLGFIRQVNKAYLGVVLVLEPSKVLRLLLQQLLENMQLKVVFMQESLQALQRLLTEPFDLIIVSVELEVLKGPALISAVQVNKGLNADTPVMLLTSQLNFQPTGLSGVKVLARSPLLAQQLEPEIRAILADNYKNAANQQF
ncbi:Hpt domain-containing protein [Rheinheimera sp.]|uniref:Hpt domain-containing protein n=1 Tax=Rheinheimera sp. TaxID=1869214 RepID=UPI004047BBFF